MRWKTAALLLLASSSFAAKPPPSLSEGEKTALVAAWTDALGALESTRPHSALLKEGGARIVIRRRSYSGTGFDEGTTAWTTGDGNVYVDEGYLQKTLAGLAAQGVPPKDAAKLLARKTVPHIAHEIRHLITLREVREATGETLLAGLVESEFLSYWEEAKTVDETQRRWHELTRLEFGRFDSSDRALLKSWRLGFDRFEADARALTGHFVSVRADSDAEFAEKLRQTSKDFRNQLEASRLAQEVAQSPVESERKYAAEVLAKLPPPEELERRRAWAESVDRFLEKPERVGLLRRFYNERYARLRAGAP